LRYAYFYILLMPLLQRAACRMIRFYAAVISLRAAMHYAMPFSYWRRRCHYAIATLAITLFTPTLLPRMLFRCHFARCFSPIRRRSCAAAIWRDLCHFRSGDSDAHDMRRR